MKKIDITKTYRTKNGYQVEIYKIYDSGKYPVHGAVLRYNEWESRSWTIEGYLIRGCDDMGDLVEAKPRIQITETIWVNVYTGNYICVHDCLSEAEGESNEYTVARVPVEIKIDCEPGEGLESQNERG